MTEGSKFSKCRYGFLNFDIKNKKMKNVYICRKNGNWDEIDGEHICENCEHYKCKYIEYPIEIKNIQTEKFDYEGLYKNKVGKFVKIRLCDEKDKKTYLGILLGELPTQHHITYDKEQNLNIKAITNPAIFVFELNKIVFGYESWWSVIEDASDAEKIHISDEDIDKTWYVQVLKNIIKEEKE